MAYGEIALKSRYVRNRLERVLSEQIRLILKKNGYERFKVSRRFGRIYVDEVDNEAALIISRVFGVVSSMPAYEACPNLDSIIRTLLERAEIVLREKDTFAVRPRLIGEHNFSRRDLAVHGGSAILEAFTEKKISVNLDEPDKTFYIEVRDNRAFIYTNIIQGVAGLPYGTQGRVVSLFSGGIDSPVATWMLMKRGVEILPLFMDQVPYVGQDYVERAKQAFNHLKDYVPDESFSLYVANISDIMKKILECEEPRYRCIICKRSMYKIAEFFAIDKQAKGIVTGESLGQVASQTLDNLYVLNEVASIPVFRPIIGLDKVEIEHVAQRIGTYKLTAKSVSGCTVVPETPATKSSVKKIKELEKKLKMDHLCKNIAETISRIKI